LNSSVTLKQIMKTFVPLNRLSSVISTGRTYWSCRRLETIWLRAL